MRTFAAAALLTAGLLAGCTSAGSPPLSADPKVSSVLASTPPPALRALDPSSGQTILDTLVGDLLAEHAGGSTVEMPSNGNSRWQKTVYLRPNVDGQVDVAVYAAKTDRDAYVTGWKTLPPDGHYLNVGDTWTVQTYNAADAEEIARVVGGERVGREGR
jgi:hypothetical protein